MERNARVYETYRLNLDNTRLFGISLVLLVALSLSFLAGVYIGKVVGARSMKAMGGEVPSSATMALFSNMAAATQVQGYDFYRALPKERLTSEDLATSIPLRKVRSDAPRPKVGTSYEADGESSGMVREPPRRPIRDDAPVRRSVRTAPSPQDDSPGSVPRRLSRPDASPAEREMRGGGFFLQVASFREMHTAEALGHRLEAKSYPIRIVKARINGSLYYRVRVGPYASRVEAEATLKRLREREGFAAAYFVPSP